MPPDSLRRDHSTSAGSRVRRIWRTRRQSSPSGRTENCAAVSRTAPSCTFGQRNPPSSSRLAAMHMPVPSRKIILTRSVALATEEIDVRRKDRHPSLRAPAPQTPPQPCGIDRPRGHQDADGARRPNQEQTSRARGATVSVSAPRPMRSTAPSMGTSRSAAGQKGALGTTLTIRQGTSPKRRSFC